MLHCHGQRCARRRWRHRKRRISRELRSDKPLRKLFGRHRNSRVGHIGAERVIFVCRATSIALCDRSQHDWHYYCVLAVQWHGFRLRRRFGRNWTLPGALGPRNKHTLWGESLRGSIIEPRRDMLIHGDQTFAHRSESVVWKSLPPLAAATAFTHLR